MRTRFRQPLFAVASFAFIAVAAAQQPEAPVAVNVDGLPSHVRERILDKAQKGQTALIQYLQRTQTVHQLRPEFVIKDSEARELVTAPSETKLAQRTVTPND